MKQKHMNIQKNYIANRLLLEFNCYNTERIIDDSLDCVKVQTEIPKDIDMTSGEFVDMETEGNIINTGTSKGVYFNFGYTKGLAHELNKMKKDIKNGYIRKEYGGPHNDVKAKIIMPSNLEDKVKIKTGKIH